MISGQPEGLLTSRWLTYACDLLLAIFSVFSLIQISEKVRLPISFETHGDTLVIASVEVLSGLKAGDRLLELKGERPTSELHLEYLLDQHRQRDNAEVIIQREDEGLAITMPLAKYYDRGYLLSISLAGLIYFFFGLFLKVKKTNDRAATIAHWLSISLAATILFTWGSDDSTLMGLLLKMIFIIAYSIAPAIYIHFSSVFPSQLAGWRSSLHKLFYTSGILLGGMGACSIYLLSQDLILFSTYRAVSVASNLNFAIGALLAVANYIYAYQHALEEADRRKIRWIITGNAFSVSTYVFLWLTPRIIGQEPLISEGLVILLASVAPVTFTIAIVRYHLFDIDRLFNRASVYLMVIGAVLAIYSSIVTFLAAFIEQTMPGMISVPSIIASVVIAICFDPLRVTVQKFVDRRFFRVRYNYRHIIRQVNSELERVYDTDSLRSLLEVKLTELFHPIQLAIQFGEDIPGYEQTASNTLLVHRSIVEEGAAATVINSGSAELIYLFRLEDARTRGVLRMGAKRSERRYSLEDIELLNAMTSASVLALQRIVVTKELVLKNEEARALKELNEMKSLFVSSVTHDLKTPLTSIKMFTEMLSVSYGPSESDAKEYLGIIGGETDRLKGLIDNILDYSKIEKGIMRYNVALADMNELILNVLAKTRYLLEMQKFRVEVEIAEDGLPISVDSSAVESVLTNVIGNSIKYSADDRYIHIRSAITDGRALITITDHGIGIAEDDIQNIFKPFYRGRTKGGSQASGAGLGLANVKQVMEAHNGDVTVESTPGAGTTVRLSFPLDKTYV